MVYVSWVLLGLNQGLKCAKTVHFLLKVSYNYICITGKYILAMLYYAEADNLPVIQGISWYIGIDLVYRQLALVMTPSRGVTLL